MFITIMDEYLDLRDTKKKIRERAGGEGGEKKLVEKFMSPLGARGRNGMPFFLSCSQNVVNALI